MMATAAVIGLTAGKRLLNSSSYYSDITERLSYVGDHGFTHCQSCSTKNVIVAKRDLNYSPSFPALDQNIQTIKALKEHVDTAAVPSAEEMWYQRSNEFEDEISDFDSSLEALLLLQKSMLEKQWNLSFESAAIAESPREKTHKKIPITCSGISARQRRINFRRKTSNQNKSLVQPNGRMQLKSSISPELIPNRSKGGYVKGAISEQLLPHAEVVRLSEIIRIGLSLEERKSRLKERLGTDPTDEQLATSLRISRSELQSKLMECSLAREKLAMSNVRLVLSIAQRYENMGAEMGDLVQGGLIGLLRGIEKFESSKGFKISTYVYWWIRQGVSRALIDNSKTLRLPTHLHERLGLIRNAKIKLQEDGITPSIDRIAESLKMSQKKVRNATEAISKVFSLDRDAFPSLNGLPGETHHSYIADNCLENNPWHGVDEWLLKEEVNKLINSTLQERERDIIRLYHGLDDKCLTWEDISKRIGLSRERVRQVGLVALEKLKNAARKRNMEAMLMKH
ncbi:putative RNA polymerase sigma factor rpoD [Tripterygium wilfordii]|uniref:Putative RNA polymerase sigma factor rpoD n=1 Tax=Tripterygium wilfordii TaxID=458696 RepID=A0A7J7CMI8_TRIWF|nr:RNA polymerase sigma factor sigA-like [Tripterygium wilfordii]XP_038724541.1 RNA polymerase sigma factor sigA-like [Tripterygium wilfordii]KAF5735292.1 putative RNA polymerase sigma factor rpoD [Tripterygium wilfordii]